MIMVLCCTGYLYLNVIYYETFIHCLFVFQVLISKILHRFFLYVYRFFTLYLNYSLFEIIMLRFTETKPRNKMPKFASQIRV